MVYLRDAAAAFARADGTWPPLELGETPAHAICLAALKLVALEAV